jgi:tellurite resistance protein
MNKFTTLATGLALAVASMGAFAQGSFPTTSRIDQREANQQARIEAGINSGQLSRREARRLEREQAQIRAAERHAKADGVVTPRERRQLERLLEQASANIREAMHDAEFARRR